MVEVAEELATELAEQESVFNALVSKNLEQLNSLAEEKDVPYIVTP